MKYKYICVFLAAACFCTVQSSFAETEKTPADLRNADITELARQPKFDSREYGIITPVKDQGYTSLCWAYATAAASEASVLRSGMAENANNWSFSPFQIGYARHNRGTDPLNNTIGEKTNTTDWRNSSGGTKYAAALLSQWCGPVKSDVPYDADGWKNAAYKLENALAVNGANTDTDMAAREKMKKAVVKYGAVTFSYNNARETFYYNPKGENGGVPHACTVIGWDDTIPAENFGPGETSQNGGWLIKNSYSSLPYFYLSYDTVCEQIFAFEYAENTKYDYNYFYDAIAEDGGVGSILTIKRAANLFEAENDNEYIKAVSVKAVGEDFSYTAEIYTGLTEDNGKINYENAVLVSSQTKFSEYGGFICIEFDNPVKIEKGTMFAVVVTLKSENGAYIALSQNEGNSYVYRNAWIKYAAPRIKVFTKTKEMPKIEFLGNNKVRISADGATKQIVAAQFENEVLTDIYTVTADFEKEKTKTIQIPFEQSSKARIKVFLWNGFAGIMPLCEAAEYGGK